MEDLDQPDQPDPELPTYTCHKEVQAAEITEMHPGQNIVMCGDMKIIADAGFFTRHPQVGGYYVLYADGYESFSPKDTFEDGYTLNE